MGFLGTSSDDTRVLLAISRSQAVIEFDLQGNILSANGNFCQTLGYSASELVGKHHRIFCDPATVASAEYRAFWERLSSGSFDAGTYKRITKDGREVWIQASYNPVMRGGRPYKVVKIAADITAATERATEDAGKLSAISRSQAVIEFKPDGEIIYANENFCAAMGYSLDELVGKHHRIFCPRDYVATAEYCDFWQRLASGEYIANEFVRVSKSGQEVWIQAAYNPILNAAGQVIKVVKFATDVTERMSAIRTLDAAFSALSQGDLTKNLEQPFVPSMEKLRGNFNQSVARLNQTMREIGESAYIIADASAETSGASAVFSKRTEQQAASLEETAAALEEITTTVTDTSHRARDAGHAVASVRAKAETAGSTVTKATSAMGAIEQSSREIASILTVIDTIAFQTNLLALNAGVEAARAGEAGKGFAVVAQEVRDLAQRAAAAAKDINQLITRSDKLVHDGVELVSQTGHALLDIVDEVKEVDAHVSAIADAAREQAVALNQINVAVSSMDQATQQNAAMAEESTAASAAVAEQAKLLRQQLSQFRTGAAGWDVAKAAANVPRAARLSA